MPVGEKSRSDELSIRADRIHRIGMRVVRGVMMVMFKSMCLTVLLAFANSAGISQAQKDLPPMIHDAEQQLEEGRNTLDEQTLMAARQVFERCAQERGDRARCYYDLGRTDSYMIQAREYNGNRKGALEALDSGIENARRAVELDENFADAHALLGDLYGRKIGYGGMLAGMKYGSRAEAEVNRAMQLDSNDPRIYVVEGRRELYSPKMFGGDIDKAIESFRRSTTINPNYDEGFVWLAIAYDKKGDRDAAKAAVAEALRLNHRSVFAKKTQASLK